MRMTDIIGGKRDGGELTPEEIRFFVRGYTDSAIPDYQASALLMAIYLRGMSDSETANLTAAMAESGQQLDTSALKATGKPTMDKHSTGGVGDKTSLVVVPMLAAAGILVCKMSGRGLGHTGGTLDKLEAIPGFRIGMTPEEMLAQVSSLGACLAGQTGDLAPADKKLYALRDATATVGSLPLIISSILSKKLAGGAESFLFDVKVGGGALMETEAEARQLARGLAEGAAANHRRASVLLTDMTQPLGYAIGNALEIREAVHTLSPANVQASSFSHSSNNARFRELCITLAAAGIELAGIATGAESVEKANEALETGAAYRAFERIVEAQGGDISVLRHPERLAQAPVVHTITARTEGYIAAFDTRELGNIVVALGGGRATKEDTIDPSVGLLIGSGIGAYCAADSPLAEIHARTEQEATAAAVRVRAAIRLSSTPVPAPPLVIDRISAP